MAGATSDVHGDVPYDRVTFKASHNSFEYGRLVSSMEDQIEVHHCRGLELDLVQDRRRWRWCVRHGGTYDPAPSSQFETHLGLLRAWSEKRAGHDPIFVTLDLKNAPLSAESFPAEIDAVLRDALGRRRLFTPGDLLARGDATTLAAAVARGGWPTVAELRGRFLFCLSGHDRRKTSYAAARIADRLCFSDRGSTSAGRQVTGNRIVINHHLIGVTAKPAWSEKLRALRAQPGLLFRAYYCNSSGAWGRAKEEGVNILATDELRLFQVGREPFARRMK